MSSLLPELASGTHHRRRTHAMPDEEIARIVQHQFCDGTQRNAARDEMLAHLLDGFHLNIPKGAWWQQQQQQVQTVMRAHGAARAPPTITLSSEYIADELAESTPTASPTECSITRDFWGNRVFSDHASTVGGLPRSSNSLANVHQEYSSLSHHSSYSGDGHFQ